MAKTLLLLRHAKSSWADSTLEDFERPLNKRGQKAAPRIGAHIRSLDLVPDLALCSDARRAIETWDLAENAMSKADGTRVATQYFRSLYLAAPSRILAVVRRVTDDVQRVIIIGHNPGMEHLAERLAGNGSEPEAVRRLQVKFPTAALAEIRFDGPSWRDLNPEACSLVRFVVPKDL